MAVAEFKMPDVGEGLIEADVLRWLVKPGDPVAVNQVIVEVETAKAAVELPSPHAGVVAELRVAEGETVAVGAPIITIDLGDAPDPDAAARAAAGAERAGAERAGAGGTAGTASQASTASTEDRAAAARQPVLVGYGPRQGAAPRRSRRPRLSHLAQVAPVAQVLAKPPVRKLAKTLGVELAALDPTGPNGTLTRADVEQAAGRTEVAPAGGPPGVGQSVGRAGDDAGPDGIDTPLPTGGPRGRETRVPIKGVRKHTAAAMVRSAFTAPHVTEFMTVDVTALMELRERIAARREFQEVKVSPLILLARAVTLAARRAPQVNAHWDEAAGEIVFKHYVNLGIATATERGLLVPNVKDADRLSLLELARAIGALTELARAGRTPLADMSGGTITITNVGVYGVDTGTPIINPGESAIVALGAIRRMPWVVQEQVVPRWVTQLAVSFDHRLIDGQQGSEFLADVAGTLADPGLALL